jgi:hypothetical protein
MKTLLAILIAFVFIASIADNSEELIKYAISITVVATLFLFFYLKNKQDKKKNIREVSDSFPYSIYSKVVGVSFNNNDGTSRQENIKKYLSVGDELHIKGYNYNGNPAIALLAKEGKMNTQVGNLSAELVEDIMELPEDMEILIVVKNITGGTPFKPTIGVNIEIFSTNRI